MTDFALVHRQTALISPTMSVMKLGKLVHNLSTSMQNSWITPSLLSSLPCCWNAHQGGSRPVSQERPEYWQAVTLDSDSQWLKNSAILVQKGTSSRPRRNKAASLSASVLSKGCKQSYDF